MLRNLSGAFNHWLSGSTARASPEETGISSSRMLPELVIIVISFLADDTGALKACALTSREWFPIARPYLFRSITLLQNKDLAKLQSIAKAGLGRYIQELAADHSIEAPFTIPFLGVHILAVDLGFTNMNTLRFRMQYLRLFTHLISVHNLRTMPHVRAVELSKSCFRSRQDVMALLLAFPNITSLSVDQVNGGHSITDGSLSLLPSSFIRDQKSVIQDLTLIDFNLGISEYPPILEIVQEVTDLDLRKLHWENWDFEGQQLALAELLRSAHDLKRLYICLQPSLNRNYPGSVPYSFQQDGLASICLNFVEEILLDHSWPEVGAPTIWWGLNLLQCVRSTRLRQLVIGISCGDHEGTLPMGIQGLLGVLDEQIARLSRSNPGLVTMINVGANRRQAGWLAMLQQAIEQALPGAKAACGRVGLKVGPVYNLNLREDGIGDHGLRLLWTDADISAAPAIAVGA